MDEFVLCIVLNDKGEILLQKKTLDYKRYPGMWSLFGGAKEEEDIEKEMKRELLEELGVDLDVKHEFDFDCSGERCSGKHYIFSTKINDLSKASIGEGAGIAFFGKDELESLEITPDCVEAIKMFFEKN